MLYVLLLLGLKLQLLSAAQGSGRCCCMCDIPEERNFNPVTELFDYSSVCPFGYKCDHSTGHFCMTAPELNPRSLLQYKTPLQQSYDESTTPIYHDQANPPQPYKGTKFESGVSSCLGPDGGDCVSNEWHACDCKLACSPPPPSPPPSTRSAGFAQWKPATGPELTYMAMSVDAPASYEDAKYDCLVQGMQLASLHSPEEFEEATKLIASQQGSECDLGRSGGPGYGDLGAGKCRTWLGLYQKSGGYIHEDGTSADYLNWEAALGQPGGDGDDCVAMGFGFGLGYTVVSCKLKLSGFFCRRAYSPSAPAPPLPPPPPPPQPKLSAANSRASYAGVTSFVVATLATAATLRSFPA